MDERTARLIWRCTMTICSLGMLTVAAAISFALLFEFPEGAINSTALITRVVCGIGLLQIAQTSLTILLVYSLRK